MWILYNVVTIDMVKKNQYLCRITILICINFVSWHEITLCFNNYTDYTFMKLLQYIYFNNFSRNSNETCSQRKEF